MAKKLTIVLSVIAAVMATLVLNEPKADRAYQLRLKQEMQKAEAR